MKVGLFVPTTVFPSFHWYTGVVPPLTGVAVKVTWVPEQTGLAEGVTDIPAAIEVLTDIVMAFDFTGLMVAQVRFEVIWQ